MSGHIIILHKQLGARCNIYWSKTLKYRPFWVRVGMPYCAPFSAFHSLRQPQIFKALNLIIANFMVVLYLLREWMPPQQNNHITSS